MSRRAGPPVSDQTAGGRPAMEEVVRRGVALYNAGRFWEAHEAVEIVWRQSAPPERSLWQGLIQAAAAMLHRERGNRHGLQAQGRAAVQRLGVGAPAGFPVETARFVRRLARCVEEGGPIPPMECLTGPAARRAGPSTKDA